MHLLIGRRRKRCLLLTIGAAVTAFYSLSRWISGGGSHGSEWDHPDTRAPCNNDMKFGNPDKQVIGILGPRGSGVYWLRHMVEQMTGLYSGSPYNEFPEVFHAEGDTEKASVVMAHRIEDISGIVSAAIVVYRRMQETVQTQYDLQHPTRDQHSTLHTYYGKEWPGFAVRRSQEWADGYQGVLEAGVPLLVLSYSELEDPGALRSQLLRISNFLHTPIKSSVFECIVRRSQEFHLKPPDLRAGVQPYTLLQRDAVDHLIRLENHVHEQVRVTRDRYRPKVR